MDNSTPPTSLLPNSDGILSGRGSSEASISPTLDNYGLLSKIQTQSQSHHLGPVMVGSASAEPAVTGSLLLDSFVWGHEPTHNAIPNIILSPNQNLGTGLSAEHATKSIEINLTELAQVAPLQPIDRPVDNPTHPTENPVSEPPKTKAPQLHLPKQHLPKQKIGIQATQFDAKHGLVDPSDVLLFGGGVSQHLNTEQIKDSELVLHYLADKAQQFKIPQIKPVPVVAAMNLSKNEEAILRQSVLSVQNLSIDKNTADANIANNQRTSNQRMVENSSKKSISTAQSANHSRQAQLPKQPETGKLQRIRDDLERLTKTVETLGRQVSKISA